MKKVLLVLCSFFLVVPAFAVEVYNNGDNSVGIYGTIRGYVGYGMSNTSGSSDSTGHNMLYGLQTNSRIGVNVKLSQFTGQVEIGAQEQTFRNSSASNTIGFRQMWGAWTFNNGHKLLFGKTDTPTTMSGYSSDIFNNDQMSGFGGNNTGNRRFQIAYSFYGVTLALIEDDTAQLVSSGTNSAGNTVSYNTIGGSADNTNAGFTDGAKYTPRAAISYDFKSDSLTARVAATYTANNGYYTSTDGSTQWTNLHAFGIVAGVKPTFGNMWVAVQARYGMNEDLYGEANTYYNGGSYSHTSMNPTRTLNEDGSFNDIHRVNAMAEFGIKLTSSFALAVAAGYQATIPEVESDNQDRVIHSYGLYVQGKYDFAKYFSIIPQIGWYDTYDVTEESTDARGGLLIGAQLRATF